VYSNLPKLTRSVRTALPSSPILSAVEGRAEVELPLREVCF
jgi:hypothetical protein